ncbi:MAG TPA: hypothetical protein VKT82_34705 [Ktedonobacterales bacterium]|nr:hypothetical protein [Ktedonobacterales bacterium]
MLWRQGDVLIADIPTLPDGGTFRQGTVLVTGEATGHAHRVEDTHKAEVWEVNGQLYLNVLDATRIVHDEHLPISLPPGIYRVWQQREYSPRDIRTIRD